MQMAEKKTSYVIGSRERPYRRGEAAEITNDSEDWKIQLVLDSVEIKSAYEMLKEGKNDWNEQFDCIFANFTLRVISSNKNPFKSSSLFFASVSSEGIVYGQEYSGFRQSLYAGGELSELVAIGVPAGDLLPQICFDPDNNGGTFFSTML